MSTEPKMPAMSELFGSGMIVSEVDLEKLAAERLKNTSFAAVNDEGYTPVQLADTCESWQPVRPVDPAPFVPGDPRRRAQRCELILRMQADGLAKRLEHTHAKTAVIGISGGLDSCLDLLVSARAMRQLGRPAADVLAADEQPADDDLQEVGHGFGLPTAAAASRAAARADG